jgi:hypothetical protein
VIKTAPVEQKVQSDGEIEETHPAFATIAIHRTSGNVGKLFGSHLNNHMGTVRITLQRAKRYHSLSRDWIFGESRTLVELELSHTQFAELITSLNMGSGVPCTLRRLPGEEIPGLPNTLETEQEKVATGFEAETRAFGKKLAKRFEKVHGILDNKKAVSKKDRDEIREVLRYTLMEVDSNMPFVLKQFIESTEKVAQAAKAEVDGFLGNALMQAGLEHVKDKVMALVNGTTDKTLPADTKTL